MLLGEVHFQSDIPPIVKNASCLSLWAGSRGLCDMSPGHRTSSALILGCCEHPWRGRAQHTGHLLFHPDHESLTWEGRESSTGSGEHISALPPCPVFNLMGNSQGRSEERSYQFLFSRNSQRLMGSLVEERMGFGLFGNLLRLNINLLNKVPSQAHF